MKFRFERAAKQAVRFTWGHGRYLDPWSIVHFLTGGLGGIVCTWFHLNLLQTLGLICLFAVLYEVGELAVGIAEDIENAALDVVIGTLGSFTTFWFFAETSGTMREIMFVLIGVVDLFLLYLGWKHYLKRRLSGSGK